MADLKDKVRLARAVLCLVDGSIMGALPLKQLALPWLQEISELNEWVFEASAVEGYVLRLLDVEDLSDEEVVATYLVEVDTKPSTVLESWQGEIHQHPDRLHYAKPEAPAQLVS